MAKKIEAPLNMSFIFYDESKNSWYFSYFWEHEVFMCELTTPPGVAPEEDGKGQKTKWGVEGPLDLEHAVSLVQELKYDGVTAAFRNLWLAALIEKLAHRKSEPPMMMASLGKERHAKYIARRKR